MTADRLPTVLIVDDEPPNIEILAEALGDGCDTLFATSGMECLELAASLLPDLVLLDVVMPGMDGFEVCARLKENANTADIPVIFVTALGDVAAEIRGLELGAMDYIGKPISPPVVKVRVRHQIELKRAREELRRLSITDGLTGLYNRRRFDEQLEIEYQRLSRSRGELSLVLFDVDFFKRFNDTYGHLAGDDCLRAVGATIRTTLNRPADAGFRYGGEEFACILPDTDRHGAAKMAETMRAAVAALGIAHCESSAAPHVTISLGAVTARFVHGKPVSRLVDLADEQLYRAKNGGRNRVCATGAD